MMLFFKPQLYASLKPIQIMKLAPMLQMQMRPFVKSMEERKEDQDRKAF